MERQSTMASPRSYNRPIALLLTLTVLTGCSFAREDIAATSDASVTSTDPVGGGGGSVWTNTCSEEQGCDEGEGLTCRAGVCQGDPPAGAEAHITEPLENKPTTDAPNLSCLTSPEAPDGGPEVATLYGAVTRFGSGRKTFDVEVHVYGAEDWDPSECEALGADDRDDCYGDYGTPIGTALSVAPEAAGKLPETCAGHHECPLGYECLEGDLDYTCEEQFGLYEIPDVPTNTPLVLRARATTFENKWHDTYTFNVFLHSDTVVDGRVHYDATMVSHGQWLLTANTVALADIPPEHGAIGGRVRDCRIPGERASWPVSEVTLALAAPPQRTVFFNNLEDDTVPLVERQSTNILGRFAALDIEAGWNLLAGSARIDGEVVSMGSVDVYVIPDALSVVTFPGRQPFWKQE